MKLYCRGQLVKVHPRQQPGRRSTDPADLPAEKTTYAMRDLDSAGRAPPAGHGDAIGVYAERLLDTDLPWTKMRQVYRLLGLVRRYGRRPGRYRLPAGAGAGRRQRHQDRLDAGEGDRERRPPPRPAVAAAARFARDPAEYRTRHVQLTLIDGGEAGTR